MTPIHNASHLSYRCLTAHSRCNTFVVTRPFQGWLIVNEGSEQFQLQHWNPELDFDLVFVASAGTALQVGYLDAAYTYRHGHQRGFATKSLRRSCISSA
jgi:hypothetical protein